MHTTTTVAARAEAAIRRLAGIEEVRVEADGASIKAIHVLAPTGRPAKSLVRDVTTALQTQLGLAIDFRIVSVAFTRGRDEDGTLPQAAPEGGATPALEEPARVGDDRIRFESVNLFVAGPRTQAQVELRWKGLPRMGSASGWSTRDESHRLVAQATATAVQEFLADPVALSVQGVEFLDVGRRKVAVVSLSLLAHRQERALTGSCSVEQDTPQAVVLATLAALNRVVAGLSAKEPTEYVLRPLH